MNILFMRVCVSTPESCVGGRSSLSKRKCSKRRKSIKQRVLSHLSDRSLDKVHKSAPSDRSHNNPTFHGSIEEAWFDSAAILDSDCDEDFESVLDDVLSQNGFEGSSV